MYVAGWVGRQAGVMKSIDGGGTWQRIGAEDIKWKPIAIGVDPQSPDVFYIMGEQVLDKSLNGGKTWGDITPPLTTTGGGTGQLQTMWVDPAHSSHLLVGCIGRSEISDLLASQDGGMSWSPSGVSLVKKDLNTPNFEALWPFFLPHPSNGDALSLSALPSVTAFITSQDW